MLSSISGIYFAGHRPSSGVTIDPKPMPTNLVVYYDIANTASYSGSSTTSLYSLTTITNTATIANAPQFDAARPKNIQVAGTSTVTLTSSTTAYISDDVASTVSFWFRYDSFPTTKQTLTKQYYDAASSNYVSTNLFPNGTISLEVITSDGNISQVMFYTTPLPRNVWHMVTFVYKTVFDFTARLFVNGTEVNSNQVLETWAVSPRTQTLTLPMAGVSGAVWSRYMQWNTELTANQITGMYLAQKDYFYPPTLSTFYDISNALSYSSASSPSVVDIGWAGANQGIFGNTTTQRYISTAPKAMGLGLNGRMITYSHEVRPSPTRYTTFSFWIKAGSLPQPGRNIFSMSTSGQYLQMSQYPANSPYGGASGVLGFFASATNYYSGNNALVAGVWRMITLVFIHNSTLPSKIYVNDTLSSTFTAATTVTWDKTQVNFEISMLDGGYTTSTNTVWSQFRIDRKEYTASDVSALFAANRGYFGV